MFDSVAPSPSDYCAVIQMYNRIVTVEELQTLVINLLGVGLSQREMIYSAGTPLQCLISMQKNVAHAFS